MPKGERKSKGGKSKKDKPAAAPAAVAETASKGSGGSRGKGGKRNALGSPQFVKEVNQMREFNLSKGGKKEEERKAAKSDLKQALEVCIKLADKACKLVGNDDATTLGDNISADTEKLKIMMAQDEAYVEEVRFKHNKLHDLLDTSRDFTPQQLQKDLVRNREIRAKCSELIRGNAEQEQVLVNPEELLELVKVRNSLRLWFGGVNMAKGGVQLTDGNEKSLFQQMPSDIRAVGNKRI